MKYYEFKEICRKAWSEKFNCLGIDMTKKNQCEQRIFKENKNTYIDCICEGQTF